MDKDKSLREMRIKKERKMKIVISQPMKGKTVEEIKDARKRVCEKAIERDDIVIDSILDKDTVLANTPLACLAQSLEIISHADAVVFLLGFGNARGCKIEYLCCKEYGIKFFLENEYLKIRELT